MKPEEQHPADQPQVDTPEGLKEDLRALFGRAPAVPQHVDEVIRAQAQERLARPSRRPILRWLWPVATAAAVLLIVMWPGQIHHDVPAPGRSLKKMADRHKATSHEGTPYAAVEAVPPQPVAGDVDGSGKVDVLDAFALARRIQGHESLKPEWDVTGDGRIDGSDVDAIAKEAVSLSRRDD